MAKKRVPSKNGRAGTTTKKKPVRRIAKGGPSKNGRPAKRRIIPKQHSLPGTSEAPTGEDESWRQIDAARLFAFDQAVPAYLLDSNYYFLDWNAAFDVLVAEPLSLRRVHSHAEDFIRKLVNAEAVYSRARQVFAPGSAPLLDTETLVFNSPYGKVNLQKLAVQVINDRAETVAWAVYLNVSGADQADDLWAKIAKRINQDVFWARYQVSYDKLLLNFKDYTNLIKAAISRLESCRKCLDLGSGSGNGTLPLLKSGPKSREVWAFDFNYAMMRQLIAKVSAAEAKDKKSYFSRLRVLKANIEQLGRVSGLPDDFDGVLMTNVLYTLDDPVGCLKQICDVLKPGGKLVLTTPYSGTDIDKLFAAMKADLTRQKLFGPLTANFNDAYERNLSMKEKIQKDSIETISGYVTNAGFRLVKPPQKAYVDAVVLIEAVKE